MWAVVAALLIAIVLLIVFPRNRGRLPADVRLAFVRLVLSGMRGPYSLPGLTIEKASDPEATSLVLRLRVVHSVQNFFGSLHGGAIATLVDLSTTMAIMQNMDTFPGVSTSLGVTYMAGCKPGETVRAEATVLRKGRTMAYTECCVYRESDNVLMARGWHVKYVAAPLLVRPFLALHPYLLSKLVRWTQRRYEGRSVRFGGIQFDFSQQQTLEERLFDADIESDSGLPRNEAGKRQYFATYGAQQRQMQGFDAPLQGLELVSDRETQNSADEARWALNVGEVHANSYGSLHGGCTATLVDVLGSALVAIGNEQECGVATNLDVQYCAGVPVGKVLNLRAKVLKRGKRLVTVKIEVHTKGRLAAVGTVTKSLAGKWCIKEQ